MSNTFFETIKFKNGPDCLKGVEAIKATGYLLDDEDIQEGEICLIHKLDSFVRLDLIIKEETNLDYHYEVVDDYSERDHLLVTSRGISIIE